MANCERLYQARNAQGHDPGEVDRETGQIALTHVVDFILETGVKLGPLHRALGGLAALSEGSKAPAMFRPFPTGHRR